MKLSDFDIDFIKFKNETDSFNYKLDNTFFGLKDNSLYDSCTIDVTIDCRRNEGNITIDYTLDGFISAQCERCLSDIKIVVSAKGDEMLRLTSDSELLKEENYISVNHQIYNAYDSLYEQVCLSIPARKICEFSQKQKQCEIDHPATEKNEEVDERWAELKKLIKK